MPELHEKPAFLCKKCSHFSHTSRLGLVTPNPGRLAVMVGRAGIEPATNWLKANCSTSELTARRGAYSTAPARKNKPLRKIIYSPSSGPGREQVGPATPAA